ncbi:MAG: PEGA domain-containing protein [bacterium]
MIKFKRNVVIVLIVSVVALIALGVVAWIAVPRVFARPLGHLSVTSTPSDANVKVDGVPKGRTPITIDLPEGKYLVSVSAPSYAESLQTVEIKTNETVEVKFFLSAETEGCGCGRP